MSIRILIADDHKIVREGLCSLVEKQSDMEIVAEAENGRVAVQMAREFSPNVVVMDIGMPDLNGIEATRQIIEEAPKIKVVALSVHSSSRFAIEILKAGASGYLLKDCAFEELVRAIHTVVANQTYLSPKIATVLVKDFVERHLPKESSVFSMLTARELETLQLLTEGKTTNQIASMLHVSVKTAETYRRNIMNKLDIHNVAELTKYAIREGLTSIEL